MNEKAKPPSNIDQTRRKWVLALSSIIGANIAPQLLTGNAVQVASAYTPRKSDTTGAGSLFNDKQMTLAKSVCQQVIPRSDTLGAGDVDVHGFIDNQLYHCFDTEQQQQVVTLLDAINTISVELNQQFVDLPNDEQHSLLSKLDLAEEPFSNEQHHSFRFLKSLIVFGYYTTEEGASKELKYLALPGDFKGSVPYESVGSAFGSHAYY